jgi:hypothetical protein
VAKRVSVYYLAAGLAALALFSVLPAAWNVVEATRAAGRLEADRWALLVMWLALVQLAYAVYLVHLPDWASVWVVSVATLVLAAVYAMLLGVLLWSSGEGGVLALLGLDGAELYRTSGVDRRAVWCLAMLGLTSLLAYLSGRMSMRWRATYAALPVDSAS